MTAATATPATSTRTSIPRGFVPLLLGVAGAIIGVGSARKVSGVRWGVAGNIIVAWVITIPAAGSVAALFFWLSGFFW